MKIINVIQGSPEWFTAKCGIPSASNFDKIITTMGKPSKQRQKYMYQLAGERITGTAEESYQSEAMLTGKERESEARKLYKFITRKTVVETGFCLANGGYGCSPDVLVGKDGLLEIKCPNMSTHIGYLLANVLPLDYFQQVQGQLLVTGRKWVDFMSHYPGLKPFIIRVGRNKKFINTLEAELKRFCLELKQLVKKIK